MKITTNHYGRPHITYDLRSCPFCQSENLKLQCESYSPFLYRVVCQNCWSKSGIHRDEDGAIRLWNGDKNVVSTRFVTCR